MKSLSAILIIISIFLLPEVTYPQSNSDRTSYILVFLTPAENDTLTSEEKQVIENNHLRAIGRLSDKGILANGGPLEGGGEIMLLTTTTRKETEQLLLDDPAIKNGLLATEILSLELRNGGICDPVFPYEMNTYSFVRYSPSNQIASYKTNADFDMKRVHQGHLDKLIATGKVIAEGVFPGNDGGILIYKKGSLDNQINIDPAIKEGYLKAEMKTIWLNKGSFCDN